MWCVCIRERKIGGKITRRITGILFDEKIKCFFSFLPFSWIPKIGGVIDFLFSVSHGNYNVFSPTDTPWKLIARQWKFRKRISEWVVTVWVWRVQNLSCWNFLISVGFIRLPCQRRQPTHVVPPLILPVLLYKIHVSFQAICKCSHTYITFFWWTFTPIYLIYHSLLRTTILVSFELNELRENLIRINEFLSSVYELCILV